MSRIGKKPVAIEKGVSVKLDGGVIKVQGPKGQLEQKMPPQVLLEVGADEVLVKPESPNSRTARAFQGLMRSLLHNMVEGVTKGYEKKLEVRGVGYRAEMKGRVLNLLVGFSHTATYELPNGVNAEVDKNNVITLSSIDKHLVGRAAAEIRHIRVPEVYKGKGVRYLGEDVRQKVGKAGIK